MHKVSSLTQSKILLDGGPNIVLYTGSIDSEGSPMVNGELKLRSNHYVQKKVKNTRYKYFGNGSTLSVSVPGIGEYGVNTPPALSALTRATNEARARFRGKLYKGNAALGVTIGSYGQSRDMIVKRYKTLGSSIDELTALVAGKRRRQSVSSVFLEYVFGWKPLVADIIAASTTVIQKADSIHGVNGKSRPMFWTDIYNTDNANKKTKREGYLIVTIGSVAYISNPNLWLLERAGLLNVGSVAWDLVPWSFVVNMFVNTGALVNSITDFAGITFSNESVTTTSFGLGSFWAQNLYAKSDPRFGGSESAYSWRAKQRSLGSIPNPRLQFKIPDANWELAAIAASLVTQKIRKLDRILSL